MDRSCFLACQKSPPDFFDRLKNAVTFVPQVAQKSSRCEPKALRCQSGSPAKPSASGFVGERRSIGMSKFLCLHKNARYGDCDDAAGHSILFEAGCRPLEHPRTHCKSCIYFGVL